MQKIHLKRTKRINAGHLWVFSNEIAEDLRQAAPGSLVELFDLRENFIGIGYINPNSLIAARILTRHQERIDRAFFREKLLRAIGLRQRLLGERSACRLVYSEGDYLPGLIIDRYDGCVVLQFLTAGMEAQRELILELVEELLGPETVVLRNDSRSRQLEGLSRQKEVLKGGLDKLPVITEDRIRFEVDPLEGQKTGFFLDQHENRQAFARIVGEGNGLDLFCHTGSWALTLAASGAAVVGVDSSERAVQQARKNAQLNNVQERAEFTVNDVFDYLQSAGNTSYDFIVCDPPAFVKSSSKIKEAVRAYTDLNASCMKLIRSGGLLATSSCSYHLQKEMFTEMLLAAARQAGRSLRMLALRSQAMDHPVLLSMPETEYLKCAFLVVD